MKELVGVNFFHVYHRFEFTLLSPNTQYTVAFVIKINQRKMHYNQSPFEFSLQTTEGNMIKSARFLDDLERAVSSHGDFNMIPVIDAENGWMEFVVGEFFLKEDDGSAQARVVDVFMKNNNYHFEKCGISLDGVKITPKTMNKSGEQAYRKSMDGGRLRIVGRESVTKLLSSWCLPRCLTNRRMGYRAFLDEPELKPGDSIKSKIENVINTSTVQIAIFSPRYTESSWCLDELLLKLKIKVLFFPVFCDVKPSDLRHPKNGVYAPAFAEHEEKRRFSKKKLRQWKAALEFSSNISGYEFSTKYR
ncbi:hypothetical protein SUGI_0131150 [Cryptomeria japonica]|nr:hypothetical protein SUGI_0131150 [Cryptomeria japonica]